jgi:uncharacterized protein YdhG (YjbR/CyaY superfamily)
MQIKADSVKAYLESVPEDRTAAMKKLRTTIKKNIPNGFKEALSYGMPGFVVPLSAYPDGYHCKADTPLPFVSFASQKNFIALYHMGVYSDPKILNWFTKEYPKHCNRKLDMGKSCIRFKKVEEIPFDLIGELMTKISMKEWIATYEKHHKKK